MNHHAPTIAEIFDAVQKIMDNAFFALSAFLLGCWKEFESFFCFNGNA